MDDFGIGTRREKPGAHRKDLLTHGAGFWITCSNGFLVEMPMFKIVRVSVFLTLGVMMAGCGSSSPLPTLAEASGIVLMKGEPLAGARVQFVPRSGPPAVGMTDDKGHFTLMYNGKAAGAVPGSSLVKISKMSGEAGNELVPAKYNENSKLTLEVKNPGPNDFRIELGAR